MTNTQALVNLGCEPGSELCSGCGFQACAAGSCETYCGLYYEPNSDGKRTPSCLAAESAARELREENERLWANLLNLTTGVLYLYSTATGAYNPKRFNVSKKALLDLRELVTKLHKESNNG